MTYLASEQGVRTGKPVELYKFVGTYNTYYYTSGPRKVTFDDGTLDEDGNPNGPQVYLPVPLQRSEVVSGSADDDGTDLTIELPVTVEIVQEYGFQITPPDLDLYVFRFHSIGQFVPYWIGPVTAIKVQDNIASIQSSSLLAASMAANFPNVFFQGPCNLILYDIRCKIVEANWSGDATVTDISADGLTVTLDAIPSGATGTSLDGQLVGGVIEVGTKESRMIISQTDNEIVINYPFSRLAVGDEIAVVAGCDHAYNGDCLTKFNNQINFGGFPFIGTNNPYTDGVGGSTLPTDNTCTPAKFEGWYWEITYAENVSGGDPTTPGVTFLNGNAGGFPLEQWTEGVIDTGTAWESTTRTAVDAPVGTEVTMETQRSGLSPWNSAVATDTCPGPTNTGNITNAIYIRYYKWQERVQVWSGCLHHPSPQDWSFYLQATDAGISGDQC